jgi:hypothetical protein
MLSKHELALLDEYAATNADESMVYHTVSY